MVIVIKYARDGSLNKYTTDDRVKTIKKKKNDGIIQNVLAAQKNNIK
jgi:hypothetical protein